jgi:hypothetical protein
LAPELCSNGVLQQLGCREIALFDHSIEIVRKVHLHPGHAPTIHTLFEG